MRLMHWLITATACALAGCGSDSSPFSGAQNESPPALSPAGIWFGVEVIAGHSAMEVVALASADGRVHVIREDGQQAAGTWTMATGRRFTGDYTLALELGQGFTDGSSSGSGTYIADLIDPDAIELSFNTTTTSNSQFSGTLSLLLDELYLQPGELARVAGVYVSGGAMFTISSSGAVFGQDADTGCVANGQVSTIDRNRNLYGAYFWLGACNQANDVLNGAEFRGLIALDDSDPATQPVLFGGAIGHTTNGPVAIGIEYHRQ